MRPLSFFLLLVLSSFAHAELKWEKPVQKFQRVPEDKVVEARYAFRNSGPAPLTIKSIRSSCGCTTGKLDKRTYAPGEEGEVVMRFSFGDRKGPHLKTLRVSTDEKNAEPEVLKLIVDIHDPVTLAPGLVFWRTGEAASAKTVQLTADASQPVRVKSVTSSNPNFTATLQTVQAGAQYAVAIVPAATARKEAAEITVQTDFPADAPHTYTIHARIK